MNDIINLILPGYMTSMLLMFFFWLYAVKKTNAGVVDLGWAIGLVIMAGFYAILGPGYGLRKLLIFLMVFTWGVRISSLLVIRLLKDNEEDSRYQRIRKDWGDNINAKFFGLFQFEVVLDLVLSIPFLIICLNTSEKFSILEITGFVLCFVAIFMEGLADAQLRRFKTDSNNKGKICQQGLWNYSRHPNYFFEWMVWISYFIFALGSPNGWLAIISPVIMYFFLTKVTGVPMIEEHALKTKGEAFKEYMRTTSFFIPLPKRK